jgi:iron complex transport system substrate-binding protein
LRRLGALAWLAAGALLAAGPRQHLGPAVPAQVRRVVTLAPSLSEVVLALGAGARLVGVTRFDDDPRTRDLKRVGGYNDPEPEAVLSLKPDLVLAEPAPANRGPVTTLARLGMSIEAFPLSSVEEIERAIEGVGELLGLSPKARELVQGIEAARAHARAQAQGKPRPRVLLVFGLDPLVVAGPQSFAGELLADAGGDNAAGESDKPFFRIPEEAALRARPDLLILCGVEAPKGRAAVAGLDVRVAALPSTALLHPGPRIPQAVGDLAKLLRP